MSKKLWWTCAFCHFVLLLNILNVFDVIVRICGSIPSYYLTMAFCNWAIHQFIVCLCFHSSVNLWFVQYNKVSSVLQPLATRIIAPQPMMFLPGTSQPIRFLSSSAQSNVKAFIHSFIHLLFNTNLSRMSYWPPFWRMHYYFIPYSPSIDLWRVYWIIIQFLSLQMKMD